VESNVAKEATTPLLGSTRVVKEAATSLRSRRQVVYDVWLMTGLRDNQRIASKTTLREAYEVVTPEHRANFVYILRWTPVAEAATHEVDTFGPNGHFGALQGQHRTPEATPTCKYIWGCLCGRAHTNDLREQVRAVLRSD
jgi:hypothetical protein